MLSFTRDAGASDENNQPKAGAGPVRRRPVLGIALGAGAARGWSHIGVIRELAAHGVTPDLIAGTSIGAVVGGCHAGGQLDALEDFARSLNRRKVFGLMDVSFSGSGLIGGSRPCWKIRLAIAASRICRMALLPSPQKLDRGMKSG